MPTQSALVRALAAVATAALLTTSCTGESSEDPVEARQSRHSTPDPTTSGPATPDPTTSGPAASDPAISDPATAEPSVPSDDPLPWGPTEAEVAQAQKIVRSMSVAELAGQVIVGRWDGSDPATAAGMVEDYHLAGVQVTSDNAVDRAQVSATTAAVAEAFERTGRTFPPVLGVDQEGGLVNHLRGITVDFPAFATAGAAVAKHGRAGHRTVRRAMRAMAMELRDLGFTWVFAPVADVTIGEADVTIGSRSASSQPEVAAAAVSAAVEGFLDAGLVSATKHFPGHGAATQDSHQTLPEIDVTRRGLSARELPPFRAAVRAGAPAVMMGHLDVSSLAPGVPTSVAPQAYDLLRNDLRFGGVAITDALGMGAVISRDHPAVSALAAGADLLLMPPDTPRTHGALRQAIKRGDLKRGRVQEAAVRVVAVQLWQQRTSAELPIPSDASRRAAAAAQELTAAAS